MARRRTVNEALLQSSIRRAVYLQRYGQGRVQSVVGFLNEDVFPDLIATLESRLERIRLRGYDSGVETTKRYASMIADVGSILDDGTKDAAKSLGTDLRALAKVEGDWAVKSTNAAMPAGVEIALDGIDLRRVQLVASQPVNGRLQSEWWESLSQDAQKRIQSALGIGLTTGETVDQMVQRVRGTRANGYEDGILQVSRRQAEAIVRTSVNHVSTQAREEAFRENRDIISGVQWVSTLDSRTTPICQERDGKVYPVGEGPRPPAHWGCRSTTVAVTKSWKELGIRKRDAPESTRASMDGQIAEHLTYGEWIEEQPVAVQDDALGVSKARMLRAGKVEVSDLVHPRTGRPMTLAELERIA